MSHTTTSNHHTRGQPRCELSDTLMGGYCENLGTQSTKDGLLCEKHSRQLGLEEQVACWEAILLHIELWTKTARRRGREDIVRLLQLERAEAAASLSCKHEALQQVENESHRPKKSYL
jgi:hypothetical protein